MALVELVADVAHEVVGCMTQLLLHLLLHLVVERLQGRCQLQTAALNPLLKADSTRATWEWEWEWEWEQSMLQLSFSSVHYQHGDLCDPVTVM